MMLGVAFPLHDWQFWLVTGIALGAALWLLRGVLPVPALRRRMARRRDQRRVMLTISARTPGPTG